VRATGSFLLAVSRKPIKSCHEVERVADKEERVALSEHIGEGRKSEANRGPLRESRVSS